jgi:holin-like protein
MALFSASDPLFPEKRAVSEPGRHQRRGDTCSMSDSHTRRWPRIARPAKALLAMAGLVALQWLGDALVARTGWPVPGSLVGLLLLLVGLVLRGHVPQALDDVSAPLLRHLMLLLIPSVAAVGLYVGLLAQHAVAFLLVSVGVTALTIVVTAWTLQRLLKRAAD